jgi:hypothetical protein
LKNLNISPLRRGPRINPVRAESVFRFHHQVREFIFGNRSKWLAKLASRFLLRSQWKKSKPIVTAALAEVSSVAGEASHRARLYPWSVHG